MSRKGCPNKKQSGITYPRKCECCDYMSNNPAMFSYHKKTHDQIPAGKLCDHGCGQPAMVIYTHGKFCCTKIAQHCPEYIRQHSERVSEHWKRPDAVARKEKVKHSFIERLHNDETVEKIKDTKRKKSGLLTPTDAKNYRHYARFIRSRAQLWAKEHGYIIGRQTFHVDHKFSILDSWNAGLPEKIVNHPANLQILEAKQNASKGPKSSITLEELLFWFFNLYEQE